MNELKPMEDLCRAVAPTRTEALDAGRTRLLAEIERSGRRGPARPTFARTAVACALTLTIAAGVTIAQNIEGDAPPDRVGVLPGAPVADARDVALRARAVAWTQPDTTLNPRQWIYTKTLIAEIDGGVLGPRTRYSTNEAWRTVEGTSPPAKDPRVTVGVSEPTGKVLLGLPADPDAALARLYTEVDRINTLVEHPPANEEGPFTFRNGIVGAPRGVAAFNLVSAILESYYVPPRLQATLYGALARMPGVAMLPDSADAKGRHGLALYVVSEGYIRQEIILDRKTYRYLGSRSITIADHAAPPPGETIEKGSVLGLSALLTAAPVNGPDERP